MRENGASEAGRVTAAGAAPRAAGPETLIGRFEDDWLAGRRPNIDDFLGRSPPAERQGLLVELVHAELEFRLKAREAARVEEYLARYPALSEPEVIGALVTAEFRQRVAHEPRLAVEEYFKRFPALSAVIGGLTVAPPAPFAPAAATTVGESTSPAEGGADAAPSLPRVPGYEVLGELGRGGMGVVYRARQLGLNRLVALKMLVDGRDAGPDGLARFRGEARALARLQHPNIVQIFDVSAHDGRPFFSLEYVEGGSLDKKLTGAGAPPRQAAQLVETLARAVHAAHLAGVVHRDLKPANVLVGPRWALKITDFGLAKQLGDEAGPTRTGDFMGTPCYMAPEQAGDAKAVGPAADTYALGAMLYELLTGRPPFRGRSLMETLRQVLNQEPTPPRRLRPQTPVELETICLKCLEKKPAARYADAEALADDLRRFLDGKPVLAQPLGRTGRAVKWARRNPALAAAACLAVVALLAGVAASASFLLWKASEAVVADRNTDLKNKAAELDALGGRIGAIEEDKNKTEGKKREAEEARRKAEEENAVSKGQISDKERQRREALSRAAAADLKRGLLLCREQGPDQGLPWLAEALGTVPPDDSALDRLIRLNLSAWGRPLGPALPIGDRPAPPVGSTVSTAFLAFSPDGRSVVVQPRIAFGQGSSPCRLWDVPSATPRADLFDRGQGGAPGNAVFSPDGRTLATWTWQGLARWDVATGKPLGPTPDDAAPSVPDPNFLMSVAFEPDGKTLVMIRGKTIERLNVADGRPVGKPVAMMGDEARPVLGGLSNGYETNWVLSPDGRQFITESSGLHFRLWDAAAGKPVGPSFGLDLPAHFVFSPDGRRVLLYSTLQGRSLQGYLFTAQVVDPATGEPLGPAMELTVPEPNALAADEARSCSANFRPDGRAVWIAAGALLQEFDWTTGRPLGRAMTLPEYVKTAALSPDGRTVAALTASGLRFWKAEDGWLERADFHAQGDLQSVSFSGDGRAVAAAGGNPAVVAGAGEIRQSDADTARPAAPALVCPQGIGPQSFFAVAFSRDGKRIVAGANGVFSLLDAADGKWAGRWMVGGSYGNLPCNDVAFLTGGKAVLASGADGTVNVIDLETKKPLGRFDPRTGAADPVQAPAAPQSGDHTLRVAVLADDQTVLVCTSALLRRWDATTFKSIGDPVKLGADFRPTAAAFTADGKSLVVAGGNKAQVLDAATGRPAADALVVPGGQIRTIAISPDGKTVLTSGGDAAARLWDVGTRQPAGKSLSHPAPVSAAAFSPDGTRIVTGCADGGARLWDAKTGALLGEPIRHGDPVTAVAFRPDGGRFATASGDWSGAPPIGQAGAWDLATGQSLGPPVVLAQPAPFILAPDARSFWTLSPENRPLCWEAASARAQEPAAIPEFQDAFALFSNANGDAGTSFRSTHFSFSRDGSRLAAINDSGAGGVRLYEQGGRKLLGVPISPGVVVRCLALSPDGKTVLTATRKKGARLWDADSQTPRGPPLPAPRVVFQAALSANGRTALTLQRPGMEFYLGTEEGDDPADAPAASPNLQAPPDDVMQAWDAAAGKPVGVPMSIPGYIGLPRRHRPMAFSPAGDLAAVEESPGRVQLWDVASGLPIGPPLLHLGAVEQIMFGPDGSNLFTTAILRHQAAYSSRPVGVCQGFEVRRWRLPAPLAGEPERIALWSEVVAGTGLDAQNTVRRLDDATLADRRRLLQEKGGLPSR